jgi:hypothetical protein
MTEEQLDRLAELIEEVTALRARVAELESAERFVPFVRAIRDGVKAKDLKTLTKATDGLLEAFALYEQRAEPRAPRGAEGES